MSKQTPNHSAKPASYPMVSPGSREGSNQKSDQERQETEKYRTQERMETFPKTNTFPKNWDLSSIFKP